MTIIRNGDGSVVDKLNPLPVNTAESDIIQPVDRQSIYTETIQTHNALSINASTSSPGSWLDTNGFNTIAVTLMNEGAYSSEITLLWSNDGTSAHGWDTVLSAATTQMRSAITETKARYVRVQVKNADASARIMSAWAYLKA